MRTAHTLAALLSLGAAATQLAACDGDDEPAKLQFAAIDSTQRAAVVPVALDLAGTSAANLVTLAEIDHAASTGGVDGVTCPSRSVEGDAVIYSASGCRGPASGIRWNGRLEAVNSRRSAPLGASIDATRPEELHFVGLNADRDGAPLAVEGTLQLTYGPEGRLALVKNQLTTGKIRLDLAATCTRDGAALECKTDAGSQGELIGSGVFEVIATVRMAQGHSTGKLVLRGEDDLRTDTAESDAEGCASYTVAGQPVGRVCSPELRSDDSTTVDGASWKCDESTGAVTLTSFMEGAPIFAKVELRDGTEQQEIELAPTSHDDATQVDRFDSEATPLAEGLTCASLGAAGVRVVAVYADGTTACYATGEWGEFDAMGCF